MFAVSFTRALTPFVYTPQTNISYPISLPISRPLLAIDSLISHSHHRRSNSAPQLHEHRFGLGLVVPHSPFFPHSLQQHSHASTHFLYLIDRQAGDQQNLTDILFIPPYSLCHSLPPSLQGNPRPSLLDALVRKGGHAMLKAFCKFSTTTNTPSTLHLLHSFDRIL